MEPEVQYSGTKSSIQRNHKFNTVEPEVQYSWTRSSIQFNKLEIVYILFEPEVQYRLTTWSCSYISFEPEVQYSSKSDILDIMKRSLRFTLTLLDKKKINDRNIINNLF